VRIGRQSLTVLIDGNNNNYIVFLSADRSMKTMVGCGSDGKGEGLVEKRAFSKSFKHRYHYTYTKVIIHFVLYIYLHTYICVLYTYYQFKKWTKKTESAAENFPFQFYVGPPRPASQSLLIELPEISELDKRRFIFF